MKAMKCINCHTEWLCPTGDSVCPECKCVGVDQGEDVSYKDFDPYKYLENKS